MPRRKHFTPIDPRTTTKSRRPRSIRGKANITERRLKLRGMLWVPVRQELRRFLHIMPHGAQNRMARAIGVAPSQLHRFACEKCHHDQEPNFTTGAAILLYMGIEWNKVFGLKKGYGL